MLATKQKLKLFIHRTRQPSKLASQATFSICPLTSESAHFSDYGFDCSKEGLKYIAGYLAHKFRFKYPHLGLKTF